MNLTEFLSPGFLLTAITSIIGLIVWLVKLERRNSANETMIARLEKEVEKNKIESEKEMEKLNNEIDHHRSNGDIHFNLRISEQVEKRQEQRFGTIETQLSEINRKLDRMAGRD